MALKLKITSHRWALREAFAISRGVQNDFNTVEVKLLDEQGRYGRGEACPIYYKGENVDSIAATIEDIRNVVQTGLTREELLTVLPAGGARCALDCALWDLEAKVSGLSAFAKAGIQRPRAIETAYTIGIRSLEDYERAAKARAGYGVLKVKVGAEDPVAAVAAVHKGAPDARLIVDPNQAWDMPSLKTFAEQLEKLGVVLIEQPIPVGAEVRLDGYSCPISLCADELINSESDLAKVKGRFDFINIKLEKAGGLTAALRLASSAQHSGLRLMVGTMGGSSLGMAPALILAHSCEFVDLDGPLLQEEDWPDGLSYTDGIIQVPDRRFWG